MRVDAIFIRHCGYSKNSKSFIMVDDVGEESAWPEVACRPIHENVKSAFKIQRTRLNLFVSFRIRANDFWLFQHYKIMFLISTESKLFQTLNYYRSANVVLCPFACLWLSVYQPGNFLSNFQFSSRPYHCLASDRQSVFIRFALVVTQLSECQTFDYLPMVTLIENWIHDKSIQYLVWKRKSWQKKMQNAIETGDEQKGRDRDFCFNVIVCLSVCQWRI